MLKLQTKNAEPVIQNKWLKLELKGLQNRLAEIRAEEQGLVGMTFAYDIYPILYRRLLGNITRLHCTFTLPSSYLQGSDPESCQNIGQRYGTHQNGPTTLESVAMDYQ